MVTFRSKVVSQWARWVDLGLLAAALLIDDLFLSGTHRFYLTLPAALVIREFARLKRDDASIVHALEAFAVDAIAAVLMGAAVWLLAPGGQATFDFIPLWLGSRILLAEVRALQGRWVDTVVLIAATAGITGAFGRLDRTLMAVALVIVASWLARRLEDERPGPLARWPAWGLRLMTTVAVSAAGVLPAASSGLGAGRPTVVLLVMGYVGVGYWIARRYAERLVARERKPRQVQLAFLAVVAGAYYIISPYFCASVLGSGESYHYALQLGDFLTQLRHGVFPVLVGTSKYAFNGNVHTIRTAPYFTCLGGVLDLLTLHTLGLYGLKNLTAALSLFGGALAAFFALKRLLPDLPWMAALLALLYVSCPGVIGPLMSFDMYASQMILPWLPVFFFGLVGSLRDLDDRRALAISVFALAILWWAHPPVAVWASGVFVLARGLRLLLLGRAPAEWVRTAWGLAGLLVLTAYVFYSVQSLHLRDFYNPDVWPNLMVNVRLAWPGDLRPVSAFGTELGDLQLGYGLMVVAVLGLFAFRRAPLPATVLYLTMGIFIVLLLPTALTAGLWRLIPYKVVEVSNIWPMQRFYLLIAPAAVFAGALALPELSGGRRAVICCHAVLAVACLWSMAEVRKFRQRAENAIAAFADVGDRPLRSENIALTRSSYLIFSYYPPYYSHGVMDPAFENRVLDARSDVILDNASALERKEAASGSAEYPLADNPTFVLNSPDQGRGALPPVASYLLVFDFPGPIKGTLELTGDRGLFRRYYLPTFGEALAFGSGSDASHVVPVTLPDAEPEKVTVHLTPPAGGSVRVLPCPESDFPIKLRSLWPYTIEVEAKAGEYLETPKMVIPGYAATVNGQPVKVVSSPSGLVAVPLRDGLNTVVLTYPGPPFLRSIFWLSFLGMVTAPWLLRSRRLRVDPRPITGATVREMSLLAAFFRRGHRVAS